MLSFTIDVEKELGVGHPVSLKDLTGLVANTRNAPVTNHSFSLYFLTVYSVQRTYKCTHSLHQKWQMRLYVS